MTLQNLLILSVLFTAPAFARVKIQSFCQQGGVRATTNTLNSSNKFQQSYPGATVTVYLAGTLTLATVYSDNIGTAKSNPYTCDSTTAQQFVYVDNGTYDFRFSGTGITTPFTLSAVSGIDPLATVTGLRTYNATIGTAAQQCLAASNANQTLIVAQIMAALPTQSMPCSMSFLQGGKIQPASGQTVTLPAGTQCPLTQQCYDISLGGIIAFTVPPPAVSPVQWGADITGVADVSAQFVAAWKALAPAGQSHGGTVTVPCGNFKFLSGAVFASAQQQFLRGSGACTTLTWAGLTGSQDMLTFPDCLDCGGGGFYMNITQPVNSEIRTENTGTGSNAATFNVFTNIVIQGQGKTNSCFLIQGAVDANNDQQRFEDDHCYGYITAGWTINGFNALNVVINHSTCVGAGGSYCVDSKLGSFSWNDGDIGGSGIADFFIESPSVGGYTIHNVESESSAMFLKTPVSTLTTNLDVSNIAWSDNCLGATPAVVATGCPGYVPPGSNAVFYGLGGPARFRDSTFGAGFGRNLTLECVIGQQNFNVPGCQFDGVIVNTDNITLATLFPLGVFSSFTNGAYRDSGGVSHSYPDTVNVPALFTGPVTLTQALISPSPPVLNYTPALLFGGAAIGQTFSTVTGKYWASEGITRFVDVLVFTNLGSSTGVATITLPSTAAIGGQASFSCNSGCTGLNLPITVTYVGGGASVGTLAFQAATGALGLTNANFTNTSIVLVTGWYR
jgi:hypothetical protein